MRGARKRKKKSGIVNVPVASMGDIAFLLIIFFVLCSQFQQVTVNPPKSLDSVELNEKPRISVEIDADGNLFFQQRPASPSDVEWGVRAMLEKAKNDREKLVLFRCDESVTRDKFEPVLEAIAKGGGIIAALGERGSGDDSNRYRRP